MFFSKRVVLVVGSVHIDVFGDFAGQDGILDKAGQAYFAVGGTAYNVAAYLGLGKQNVALLSVLVKKSLISRLVKWKLRSSRVETRYVLDVPSEQDGASSAFVAHRRISRHTSPPTRVLDAAVSSMPIEQLKFRERSAERRKLDSALEHSVTVVVDANLHHDALASILVAATKCGLRVIAVATSDAKVQRVVDASAAASGRWLLVAIRQRELEKLDKGALKAADPANWSGAEIIRLCDHVKADGVILNRDQEEPLLLLGGVPGIQHRLGKVERPTECKSDTGVGSALVAAVVAVTVDRELLPTTGSIQLGAEDVREMRACVSEYVNKALRTWGATPNSSIAFDDDEAKKLLPMHMRAVEGLRNFTIKNGIETLVGLVFSHALILVIGLAAGIPIVAWLIDVFKAWGIGSHH